MEQQDTLDISYALAKKVPDMKRGFVIQTSYGDITIHAEDAAPFATLAHAMLGKQLEAMSREGNESLRRPLTGAECAAAFNYLFARDVPHAGGASA